MNKNTLFLSAILLLLILSSSITLLFSSRHISLQQANVPVAYLQNLDYKNYDQNDGSLHLYFQSQMLTHFKKYNSSTFTDPKILLFDVNQIPWHITAEKGMAWHGHQVIHLTGHIIFHHQQVKGHPETTMLTNHVYLYPQRNYAVSNDDVTLMRPGTTIKGRGMRANLKNGIITILHQTHGIYQPQNPT
jgi:lipopolysaccharide export system protein LptC